MNGKRVLTLAKCRSNRKQTRKNMTDTSTDSTKRKGKPEHVAEPKMNHDLQRSPLFQPRPSPKSIP